jgi:hypothetical protein
LGPVSVRFVDKPGSGEPNEPEEPEEPVEPEEPSDPPDGVDPSKSRAWTDDDEVTADGEDYTLIVVRLLDAQSNPLSGYRVTLESDSTTTVTQAVYGDVTDAQGKVYFKVANTEEETVQYRAYVDGTDVELGPVSVRFVDKPGSGEPNEPEEPEEPVEPEEPEEPEQPEEPEEPVEPEEPEEPGSGQPQPNPGGGPVIPGPQPEPSDPGKPEDEEDDYPADEEQPTEPASIFKPGIVDLQKLIQSFHAKLAATASQDMTARLSDIKGHWALNPITLLMRLGAISGYPDGTFKPDQAITRAEFAHMLVRLFELTDPGGANQAFQDVRENYWAKESIETLAKLGIVNGYVDGTFKPDAPITREEIVVMVMRLVEAVQSDQTGASRHPDLSEAGNYAKEALETAVAAGIISGYPDGTLKPKNEASRAEVTRILLNLLMLDPMFKELLEAYTQDR